MIKTLNKVRKEGTYLNIIKDIYDRHTASIILNGKNYKCSPQNWEQHRDVLFHFSYLTNYRKSYPQQSDKKKK